MKRNYILIDIKKFNISSLMKWVTFIALSVLFTCIMVAIEGLISNVLGIDRFLVLRYTFFIRTIFELILVYDMIPRFKKSISIIVSMFFYLDYMVIDMRTRDSLHIGQSLLLILMVVMNIVLAKKYKKQIKVKTIEI